MSLLTFQGVRKVYGGETLLDDVTSTIRDGDRIGVVGRNGAGKSTIFRLACGDETEDGGEIARGRGISIARLAQDPKLDPRSTILEETLKALAHVRALETRLRALEFEMETAEPDDAARLAEEHGSVHERFERQGGYSLEARALEVPRGARRSFAK
jgi:ATP-binding cassette subfamily F protein 3